MTFEELVELRRGLLNSLHSNGMYNGFYDSLVNVYPDRALFIYELLQNAEDVDAAEIIFELTEQGLHFRHNGTKRDFTIEDIDSITSYGNSTKKSGDTEAIGKFGIGFKSVYAYTSTPEISSGQFYFNISQLFLPGLPEVRNIPQTNHFKAWTKFYLPFDNPKKPAKIAIKEISEALRSLDITALLFLRHIKKISYSTPDGHKGSIVLTKEKGNRIKITLQKDTRSEETYWLRFVEPYVISDSNGFKKNMTIGIAYRLRKNKDTGEFTFVSADMKRSVFNYFPLVSERSNLNFCINGPFNTTLSRAELKVNDTLNRDIFDKLSNLMVRSMNAVKKAGDLDYAFLEIFPQLYEELDGYYQVFFTKLIAAFRKNELLPAQEGGYLKSTKAMWYSEQTSFISDNDLHTLFFTDKRWLKNPGNAYYDVVKLLNNLNIEKFTSEHLINGVRGFSEPVIREYLEGKSYNWLITFYTYCYSVFNTLAQYIRPEFKRAFRNAKIIICADGVWRNSKEAELCFEKRIIETGIGKIVDPKLFDFCKSEKTKQTLRDFFAVFLEVAELNDHLSIMTKLEKYVKNGINPNDKSYYSDLLLFAKYRESDIDFSKKKIFLGTDNCGRTTQPVPFCAKDLHVGGAFGDEDSAFLAKACNCNKVLWDGYRKHLNSSECEMVFSFLKQLGIAYRLEIKERTCDLNPQFIERFIESKKQEESKKQSYIKSIDYYLPCLDGIIKREKIQGSRIIWNCLLRYDSDSGSKKYLKAEFVDEWRDLFHFDSSLIIMLRESAWVPNQRGKMFKPCDIFPDEIHVSLRPARKNVLLNALGFGSNIKTEEIRALEKLERDAKALNQCVVDRDEYQKFLKYQAEQERKSQRLQETSVVNFDAETLLLMQGKKRTDAHHSDADLIRVSNGRNDREALERTFKNSARMNPFEKHVFSRVTPTTKEEKDALEKWYGGKCQMCGTSIETYNRKQYFIAKNIISSEDLGKQLRTTEFTGWNSICLCPNCAARYDHCSKDLNGLYEQIMEASIPSNGGAIISVEIELAEKQQAINFRAAHFRLLQRALQLIDEEYQKHNQV